MKTQVIHLDKHDDLISIRDHMAWAKTPRILLVWPRRGGVSVGPLDMTLLRRHAESLGAELGIVTRNGEMRAAAREQGISFFSTTSEAQKKHWRERQPARLTRRFPRQDLRSLRHELPPAEMFTFVDNPIRRMIVFTTGVLAVLVVMLVFLPTADIQIALPEQKQSLTIAVSAAPGEQSVQLSGNIPQQTLTFAIDGKDAALVTGKVLLPEQTASGEVILMNLTDKGITIPYGTVLKTTASPPVSYIIGKSVDIPAGKGKSLHVAIQAQKAGLTGNANPGTISLVDGPLGQSLAVTNPAAISGGTEINYAAATEQDRENLKKRLLLELERQARLRFQSQIKEGDVLLPGRLVQTRILEEKYDPPAGQTGEKLSLSLRVEFSMGFASFADLYFLAQRVLDASLAPGFEALPGQIKLKVVSSFSESDSIVHWQMLAERSVKPSLDTQEVISYVQGRTVSRASSLLTDTYRLAESPEIKIQPEWWPWLPFLPMRITVNG
jgi:hypothetical protein